MVGSCHRASVTLGAADGELATRPEEIVTRVAPGSIAEVEPNGGVFQVTTFEVLRR